jgi:hypothetical protein
VVNWKSYGPLSQGGPLHLNWHLSIAIRSGTLAQITLQKMNRRSARPHFQLGTVTKGYRAIDNYTAVRLRAFARRAASKPWSSIQTEAGPVRRFI